MPLAFSFGVLLTGKESFVVLDLGTAVDGRTLLTEGSYQLIVR